MKRFFSSRWFVILSTTITFVLGGLAGWLLGYQPYTTGRVSGGDWIGITSGSTNTEYLFQLKTAFGYWIIALIITFVVFLLCVLIRKQFLNGEKKD